MNSENSNEFFTWESNGSISAEILKYAEILVRVGCLTTHLTYFVVLINIKKLRTQTHFFMHHMNLVGLLYVVHHMFYFYYSHPINMDPETSNLLCTLSEIFWGMLKYLRPYSLVLLAIYRYIAITNVRTFKIINQSSYMIVSSVIILWTMAFVIFMVMKISFSTTYEFYNCLDGYAINWHSLINYYVFTTFFAELVPFVLIFVMTIIILHTLKVKMIKLTPPKLVINSIYQIYPDPRANIQSYVMDGINFDRKLTKKLILLTIFYFFVILTSFLFNLKIVFTDVYLYRLCLRMINLFFQATIPILSIYYFADIISQKFISGLTHSKSQFEY